MAPIRLIVIANLLIVAVSSAPSRVHAQAHVLDFTCAAHIDVVNGVNVGNTSCPASSSPVIVRHVSVRVNAPSGHRTGVGVGLSPTTIVWCSPMQLVGTNSGGEDVSTCSSPVYYPVPANTPLGLFVIQPGVNSGTTILQYMVTGEKH